MAPVRELDIQHDAGLRNTHTAAAAVSPARTPRVSPSVTRLLRTDAAKDSVALAGGSIASGVFAYAFFAITTRSLGPVAAAPVSVLWTFWAFAGAALTFPIQHWIIQLAESGGGESSVRAAMPRLWTATGAFALVLVTASWLLGTRLFDTSGLTFPALIGAVTLGACWSGVVRGVLSAQRRFVATGLAIMGENVLRLVAGLVAALTGQGAAMFGLALITGPLVGLLWSGDIRSSGAKAIGSGSGSMAVIGGIALGGLVGQVVLTAGPAVVALLNGPARTVTALFASLALFRLPQVILIGLLSQVTGRVTVIVTARDLPRLRRVRLTILTSTAVAALVGAIVGASVGGELVQLLFGQGLQLPQAILALLGVGSALALGNLAEGAILTAHRASGKYVTGWLAGLLVGGVLLTLPLAPVDKTVVAFCGAELAAFVALFAGEWATAAKLRR